MNESGRRAAWWPRLQDARRRSRVLVAVVVATTLGVGLPTAPVTLAAPLPGFTETTVWNAQTNGLLNPTNIEFAADGRVFVAEKSGLIKVFDNTSDPTPTVFSTLTTNVQNYWDRGLLGLALDPSLTNPALPLRPWVYVLYTYDHILGSTANPPRWGDACPSALSNPPGPGPTTDGCVVSGRLSRFTVSGTTISGPETVLIEDWCQQFPSHSIGSLGFGPDGALYISSGDGASFNAVDYGQFGGTVGNPPFTPKNPYGDPPNVAMTPPTAEGGALRSVDLLTEGAPTGSAYAQAVLQDAPAAYWRLGESAGPTANDESASNLDGSYLGGLSLGAAGATAGNTAVQLNGTSGYVAVADANALDVGNVMTYETWFKRIGTGTSNNRILIGKGDGAMALELSDTGVPVFYRHGVALVVRGSTAVTDTTAWHHLVATKSGATTKLYLDGVDVTVVDGTSTATNTTVPLNIGRDPQSSDAWFDGYMDEVAIYPTALTQARVQAHYAAASAPQTTADPATLDGAILRVDPVTGAAFPGNPYASSSDPNKQRIIAYGLRNPFRFELRPGTSELWLGDVGWNNWEEINRVANVSDTVVENFGWPCYEGVGRMAGYDSANLSICENLYAAGSGAVTAPAYTYAHSGNVVGGETCPTGGSSIAGMAFYPESGGNFPAAYRGGLFFADHNRSCIWWMAKGANGQPDPATRAVFLAPAANPVDLEIGLDGALYYVDYDTSTIRKVAFASGNQPPTAIAQANPTNGAAPLTVNFSGTSSTDPENATLAYAWDLDGDAAYDDSTSPTPVWTYTSPATVTVGLRVTDPGMLSDTDTVVISVGNTPPVPVINTPVVGTTWGVGEQIAFSGSATDQQDGTLAANRLSWQLRINHCPSGICHPHDIQAFPGVASGTFAAPDHLYPSSLDLTLTATDSNGLSASTTRRLDPRTVTLSFQTAPAGLQLTLNDETLVTPFTRTVIEGSANQVIATSPQTLSGQTYAFQSWSDGGAATHTIVAATSGTYTATYTVSGATTTVITTADAEVRANKPTRNYGATPTLAVKSNPASRSYLMFNVPALSGAVQSAKMRVYVTDASANAGSAYLVGNGWSEFAITWDNAPVISGSPLHTPGGATVGTWVEFTVTSAVVSSTTVSFALSGGSTDTAGFSSRTGGNAPQLVIATGP